VNATGAIDSVYKVGVLFNSSYATVTQNHTSNATIKIVWPYLIVNLESPLPNKQTDWIQNQSYQLTANVQCINWPCGNVNGTPRYNSFPNYPNTSISVVNGATPFYIVSLEMPSFSCGNMSEDDSCELNWLINVTGEENSMWKVDVNLTSDSTFVSPNDTEDAIIRIVVINIIIHGNALYYYTGEKVNGNITFISSESSYSFTSPVYDGIWGLHTHTDLTNITQFILIVEDNSKKGYNEIKIANPIVSTPSCSAQTIQLTGYAVDANTGNFITSGTIKATIPETGYTTSSALSSYWNITMFPCLVSGEIYTLHVLISDYAGKRGEFLQKYPAK
jgi:hypothetical protein